MGKTSYKNTEELIKELGEKIDLLNKGELSLKELDAVVETGKDLYENLVILRYKAFDTLGTPKMENVEEELTTTIPEPETTEEKEEEMSFDFSGVSTPTAEEEPQPSFDFTMEAETEEATPEIEEPAKPVEPEEKPIAPAFIDTTEEETLETDDENGNSLHDVLKQDDETSLRKQLQNSPVSDIKTHISIAKKFEYISNMFEGDSEAYDEAIDFLNTCATGEDARLKLNELANMRKWDLENKSIIKFIELVERRYL